MTPSDYIALMHGEIDGVNTAADSRRLQEYLAENPAAADHFQELRQAVAAFEGLESLEPPDHLRQRILDAVASPPDLERSAPTIVAASLADGWRTFWRDLRRQPGYRLAFTTGFAVSLLLAAMAWQLTPRGASIDPVDLRGTILRQVETGRGTRGEAVVVDLEGVAATVQAYRAGSRTLIQIVLTSDQPVLFGLLGNGQLACESYHAVPPAVGELTVTGRRVTLVLPGTGEFDIVLHHPETTTPELGLQVLDGQTVLFEQPIVWGHD